LPGDGAWVATGAAALAIAAVVALSSPQSRRLLSRAIQTLPAIGRITHEMRLARLYRTLSVLLGAGIALHPALRDVPGLIAGDPDGALSRAAQRVSEGRSASDALEQAGLTTPLARSLIASGEGGGQLARMLDEAARFLELETTRRLERAMKLIEPALMAAIGVAVGVIVVLMYLPIFELAGSLR
jgi:general secretion pathway protein F